MRCAEFEHQLNDLLDTRAPAEADAPLRLHADECDRCRQLLADQELLFTGLEMWEPPAVSSGFAQRVVAAYLAEKPPAEKNDEPAPARAEPARGIPLWLTGILATGLVAVLALGIAWWTSQPGGQPTIDQPPLVNQPVLRPAPLPEKQPPQLVDGKPALPNAAPRPEPEVPFTELLSAVQEQFPDMNPERGSEFASQVVDELRPLATPVGGVFNVLRRTLSGSKEPSRPRKPQASSLIPSDRGVA